ncbi:MAG: hypothetical protein WCZ25_12710, partial [Aminobacteriaceae bacterium]
ETVPAVFQWRHVAQISLLPSERAQMYSVPIILYCPEKGERRVHRNENRKSIPAGSSHKLFPA